MPTATFYPSVFRHPSKRSQFNRPQPAPPPPPDFTQAVRQARSTVAATPNPKPTWLEAQQVVITQWIWFNQMNKKLGDDFEEYLASKNWLLVGFMCGVVVFALAQVVKPVVHHFAPLPVKPVPTVQVK